MTTIKILGIGDAKTKALRENLAVALSRFPVGRVVEVTEVNKIAASGIGRTPALLFDDQIVSEGAVPTVDDLARLLRNRSLYRSKLYLLRRILVPVDYSPASENAYRHAWALAKRFGATLDLVHVVDSIFDGGTASASGFMSSYLRTAKAELLEFAQKTPEKWAERVEFDEQGAPSDSPAAAPRVSAKVEFGFPENVLQDLSAKYDLLVMGTTGKGALAAKLFGSMTTQLSQTAHCPVLLVPPDAPSADYRNILYASNFESNDPEKLRQVVAFSKHFDAQTHFVHVGKPNESGERLEKTLFEINYKHADPDKPFIFQKMVGDDIADKLHEYAFGHKIDLFVFVTHRRGIWENLLHKSATKQMVLHTTTPVLVVHQFNDISTC